MLINDVIKLEISKSNLNYYSRKLDNLKIGDVIDVRVNSLSRNSGMRVDVRCDYCNIEFKMEYRKYLRGIKISNKSSCKSRSCIDLKMRESNIIKHGVENVMQLDSSKKKAKRTNISRYGTSNPNQLKSIKDRIKKTNLEKYGVIHPMLLDEFKDKFKSSIMDKYGVENVNKLDWVKEKIKKTNLEKYGVDNYTKTEEYKLRTREVCNSKWGVSNYTKTKEYRERTNKTNVDKWGVEVLSHSEEFRKKNFIISNHPNYVRYMVDEKLNVFNCDCGHGHTFKIPSDNFYQRIGNILCTECYPISDSRSIKEQELFAFIDSIYKDDIIQSYRDTLEIDIYLPELGLGFEFNGLRWHSSVFKDRKYHLNKTNYFKERDIKIIHIWEDDWDFKRDILKSQIKNILSKSDNKIYARKCYVREILNTKYIRDFLNENHIQGSVGSVVKLGLYFGDQLVSLMTFNHSEGREKMGDGEWNLNRFCSLLNTNVIGGASKIFAYFVKKYDPKRIISYADKDWSGGGLYSVLGFNKIHETKPDYKYIINNQRVHKSRYRKSYTGISESKLDIPKVWDCGKIKYEINSRAKKFLSSLDKSS